MQHFQNLCRTANSLLQSATRFSLVVCVSVLCFAYLIIVIANPHDQQVILGVKESFGGAIFLILGFYYGKQVPVSTPSNTITTTSSVEIPPVTE